MTEVAATVAGERQSVFESDLPLDAKLERARTELLDLSARNRLLNIPRSAKSAKTLEVIDERTAEVFRLLVKDGKAFTFLAGKGATAEQDDDEIEIAELVQPEDDGVDARGVANRHADTRLQTRLTPAGLQKKLLDLYYDARTLEEEQGVNILFLALGTLKWVDPNNATVVRYAPLILVPVELERGNAAEKFKLRARLEDFAANLSLEAYLDRVHGLKLPTFEASDDFDPSAYAAAVADAVSSKEGWSVDPDDIVLGFFSFAKFLMYRDLDPATWPAGAKLADHALIRPLVSDGFPEGEALLSEDGSIDANIPPSEMIHIVDSDSSQTLAVEEVRRGRDLVIQGPPGTGKSQTIANVIASAIADGKTVLFVAEKMAALEVVKRRLDSTGVGDACLELHSNKANKRAVLEELRRTWELGAPKAENLDALNARLTDARDQLNTHAERLHTPLGASQLTPYEVIGQLVRLRQAGVKPGYLRLDGVEAWTKAAFEERSRLLGELAERVLDIGAPGEHLWRGVELDRAMPTDIARLEERLAALYLRLVTMREENVAVASLLEAGEPETLTGLEPLAVLARRLAEAPSLDAEALASEIWDRPSVVRDLLANGVEHTALTTQLAPIFSSEAWSVDLEPLRTALAPLDPAMSNEAFDWGVVIVSRVPALLEQGRRLAEALGRQAQPTDVKGLADLAQIGERVGAAPDADPAAFAQDLWNSGVERAADLAGAVRALEEARREIGAALSDAGWSADLAAARGVLAAHGSSFFRLFSGKWRAADRLVRSFLADPKTPLARQLALLDTLARGQAALKLIREDAEFGRSAFAGDWRGERSAAAPLTALVEWMRSLRGLGAEPRLIVSASPDRRRIADLTVTLTRDLDTLRTEVNRFWDEAGSGRRELFGSAEEPALADLAALAQACDVVGGAHRASLALRLQDEPSLAVRLRDLADLSKGQGRRAALVSADAQGRAAFGSRWRAEASDWTELSQATSWLEINGDIRALASRIADRIGLASRWEASLAARDVWAADVGALLGDLKAGAEAAVVTEHLLMTPVAILGAHLAAWRDGGEQLTSWVNYRERAKQAAALGLNDIVERLHDGRLAPVAVHDDFEQAFFEAVLEQQVEADPELAVFDGEIQGRRVREFVDLDQQRIRLAAMQVARAHHRKIPPLVGGAVGPLGVLKGEMARRRGHMPIRQLMQKAAPAVQALKPVFMMSPLSVAQFLPPGELTFDLLVMDEASQIQPVDALGAIARCRQVVVVGDPQQLPPTAFFSKMTGQADGDDDEGAAKVADIESILGLFTARGLPMRMLRWHYRSRHESLIAISNRQFYENKLVIIPSPFTAQSGLGLRFHHIKYGVFETGASRTNPVEAKAVARAIIHHARTAPELSLGVVAFSAAQRRAIMEQLELLRRQLTSADEAFFQLHPTEPFFIKNLENVQGDERDVILISIGYGPTALGAKPPMRFGPVGQDGGERRLNVLISRAKRRCEVFASLTDEDIDPDFASTRKGVFALKLFMHFARTGRMSLAESIGRDRHPVFEAQVAQALHSRGYQVHQDVGVSGLFIDIAVASPDHPERYLLAIECDGPSYKGARSARDRDRLRRSVLESQGWIVHRIWSGDWFKRPQEQLERTIAAIEAAKVEVARDGATATRLASYEIISVEREDVTEMGLAGVAEEAPLSQPYVETVVTRPAHVFGDIHETPTGVLSQLAEAVVQGEGPIHFDEIVVRMRTAWGAGRAGGRIRDAIRRAVDTSIRMGRIVAEGEFFSTPGADIVVRDRGEAASPTLRRPDMLPPAEIEAALVDVVSRNFGATEDQAIQAVSRAFGFKATSTQLRDVLGVVVERALEKGVLARRDTLIEVGPNAPQPKREPERPALETLIAEGEGERLEFKETLRWDLRQGLVNKKLEDSAMKAIAAFSNHCGGVLLIGVRDDGTVRGIGQDLACFGGVRDKFELHLTNLIKDRFSESFRAGCISVSYPMLGGEQICRIDVKRSRTPVYLALSEGNGPATKRLVVRAGASSPEIPLDQVAAYVRDHFSH
jgi:very-short-patch-repair endonuclease